MKSLILALILSSAIQMLHAQRWQHIIGEPGTHESFRDLTVSYDQGYVLSTYKEIPQGNRLIKTDVNGNILWEKLINWEHSFRSGYITQDQNANTILATTTHGNGIWPMLIKLDSCFEKVWCRVFPQHDHDNGFYQDIIVLDNGDYLALAIFESFVFPDRVYLDYVDKDGQLLWRKAYAREEDNPQISSAFGEGLCRYGNNYYIFGRCLRQNSDNLTEYSNCPLFISIDSLFNEEWVIPFTIDDSIHGNATDMTMINDSVFMGIGYVNNGMDKLSVLAFFDKKGNEIGFNLVDSENFGHDVIDNSSKKIEKLNDSLYIALAEWYNGTQFNGGAYITDTSGNVFSTQYTENAGELWEIVKIANNEFIIGTGIFNDTHDWDILLYKIDENLQSVPYDPGQYTYDSLCPHPITSSTIELSDCLIVADTEEIPSPEEYHATLKTIPISTFQSPAKDKITFTFENTDKHKNIQLECYNIFGQKVHEQKIFTGQLEVDADVSGWGNGIYVAVVKSRGRILGKGKFVVE